MKKILISILALLIFYSCNKDEGENDETVSQPLPPQPVTEDKPEISEPPEPEKPKIKKERKILGLNENTLVGITYSSKDQIFFLKGFEEVGGMVLPASTEKINYSMAFFEKPGARLALLEECFISSNPHYKIIDRIIVRTKGDPKWQYNPEKSICALIGNKKIEENRYAAERAWKINLVNGRIRIININSQKVYYESLSDKSTLIYNE